MKNYLTQTIWKGMIGALLLAGIGSGSHAMGIDFDPVVGTISGTNTFVFEVEITQTGVYRTVLTDLANPAPFAALAFAWTDLEAQGPLALLEGPGTLDVALDPGNYLALVGGIAGGDLNIGTFGLEISDVPVPAAGYLFATAVFSLFGAKRFARA